MSGLKKGDKVRVTGNRIVSHAYNIGEVVYIIDEETRDPDRPLVQAEGGPTQYIHITDLALIEEGSTMTEKRSVSAKSERNPKNFRNGDVVKVSDKKGTADAMVFVKFGENYYNLTAGGQMKACRYLPPGTKEIITNLSGMGKFFLMSEEELEAQAGSPFGAATTDTNEDYYWSTPTTIGHPTLTTTQYITDDMIKDFEAILQTDTTEEK